MQSHHYLLIAVALIVGYVLAHYWSWPADAFKGVTRAGG
jgi:hypothetical protein